MTGEASARRTHLALGAAILALSLAGCGSTGNDAAQAKGKGGPGGKGGGPAQVGYVVVRSTNVAVTSELAGRVVAFQSSEVRPQVSGVIQKRFFTEGSIVRRGQPLYQIDPSLYRASANQANANLSSARATADAARIRAERYRPLAEMQAVAAQDYTDAVSTYAQARASISQGQASVDTARINLRFTTVPAPISGRIGRSIATVGALVTATQADPLTTIQQLDPVYVDIQQSSAALLGLRRALASGGVAPASADVRLKLEDGSDYPQVGRVEFGEVVVDQGTGTVTLRARFANSAGLLLPGMFVRAVFAQSIDQGAFLVPQQAVARDPKGAATVWLVGSNGKAVQRTIQATRAQGAFWVVTDGLREGDRVITQGIANLKPNAPIRAVPANAPQNPAPPRQDGQSGSQGQGSQRQGSQGKAG